MSSWVKIAGGLLVGVLIVGTESAQSQSLGDLARQDRARRAAQPSSAAHVYTNEDLQRSKIIEQQKRATVSNSLPQPGVSPLERLPKPPNVSGAVQWSPGTPLGDVARYYRERKQLLQEQNDVREAQKREKLSSPPFRRSNTRPVVISAEILGSKPRDQNKQQEAPNPIPLPSKGWIRVESGDSLWKLASRYLGEGKKWREIAEANPELSDPNHIRVGQQLRLPASDAAAEGQQVRVQSGDSLWKLAQARFGDGGAWSCIVAANPQIDDANRIYPGQLLTVPARCSSSI